MPTYPRIYNDNPRKMVKVMWVASEVVKRGEGEGFWARESPLCNKEKVGSVLGVAVYGGVRRWWPVFGVAGGEKERRGRRGEVIKMKMSY